MHYTNKRKKKCTVGCTITTLIYSSEVSANLPNYKSQKSVKIFKKSSVICTIRVVYPNFHISSMSQMPMQLWKIVLHPPGFELGSFGLRDQCSTDWAKGDSLQPSQYQATGSYKHLWHIPPPRGISSSRLEVQSHFCKFDKEYFATQRNTKSTLARHCHRCQCNCVKLYCTCRDSHSGHLVYETSALPIELKGIPSSRVSIKRLVRTNTCDIYLAQNLQLCLCTSHPNSPYPMSRYRTGYIMLSHV